MTLKVSEPRKSANYSRRDAVQRLAKACCRALRDDSEEIAAALFHRAAQGNLPATRLLLKVLEENPAVRIHKKRLASGKKALVKALAGLQWVVDKPHQPAQQDKAGL